VKTVQLGMSLAAWVGFAAELNQSFVTTIRRFITHHFAQKAFLFSGYRYENHTSPIHHLFSRRSHLASCTTS
jgi:hypothetical protein